MPPGHPLTLAAEAVSGQGVPVLVTLADLLRRPHVHYPLLEEHGLGAPPLEAAVLLASAEAALEERQRQLRSGEGGVHPRLTTQHIYNTVNAQMGIIQAQASQPASPLLPLSCLSAWFPSCCLACLHVWLPLVSVSAADSCTDPWAGHFCRLPQLNMPCFAFCLHLPAGSPA